MERRENERGRKKDDVAEGRDGNTGRKSRNVKVTEWEKIGDKIIPVEGSRKTGKQNRKTHGGAIQVKTQVQLTSIQLVVSETATVIHLLIKSDRLLLMLNFILNINENIC